MTDTVRDVLLIETHRIIASAASNMVAKTQEASANAVAYPPGSELSSEEQAALQSLQLDDHARSALRKLAADACAATLFDFFNLMDATADPEVVEWDDTWLGAQFSEKRDDAHYDMLHDDFYELYWRFVQMNSSGDGAA